MIVHQFSKTSQKGTKPDIVLHIKILGWQKGIQMLNVKGGLDFGCEHGQPAVDILAKCELHKYNMEHNASFTERV